VAKGEGSRGSPAKKEKERRRRGAGDRLSVESKNPGKRGAEIFRSEGFVEGDVGRGLRRKGSIELGKFGESAFKFSKNSNKAKWGAGERMVLESC